MRRALGTVFIVSEAMEAERSGYSPIQRAIRCWYIFWGMGGGGREGHQPHSKKEKHFVQICRIHSGHLLCHSVPPSDGCVGPNRGSACRWGSAAWGHPMLLQPYQ